MRLRLRSYQQQQGGVEAPVGYPIIWLVSSMTALLLCENLFAVYCSLGYSKKEVSEMARVRKRAVRWEPSTDATKFRLYWSTHGPVGYDSEFYEVENKTMVVLPDEIPSFPKIVGNIELGVTAVNEEGNESDIAVARVYINLTVPETPKDVKVEYV